MISILFSLLLNLAWSAPSVEVQATQGNYSTGDKMTELTMRAQYESSRSSRLGVDVGMKQAFGDSKAMVAPFGTMDFNDHLYGTAAFLYSGDGVLYPSTSASGSLYYKLGEQKNWVLGGGGGRTAYADSASEQFATFDVIYYTGPWLVVQTGARHVHTEPSLKGFQRFYAALTFFMQQKTFLLRYETGGEAYAVIDDKKQQVFDFHSQVFNAAFTMPVAAQWSAKLGLEFYKSDYLEKNAAAIAGIYQF